MKWSTLAAIVGAVVVWLAGPPALDAQAPSCTWTGSNCCDCVHTATGSCCSTVRTDLNGVMSCEKVGGEDTWGSCDGYGCWLQGNCSGGGGAGGIDGILVMEVRPDGTDRRQGAREYPASSIPAGNTYRTDVLGLLPLYAVSGEDGRVGMPDSGVTGRDISLREGVRLERSGCNGYVVRRAYSREAKERIRTSVLRIVVDG